MDRKLLERSTRVTLRVGIMHTENQMDKNISKFAHSIGKDPMMTKYIPRIEKGMHKIAFRERQDYSSSKSSRAIFSTRKISNDVKKNSKDLEDMNYIPTHKTKDSTIQEYGADEINRLGDIGNLKSEMNNRLYYKQSLLHIKEMPNDALKYLTSTVKESMNPQAYHKALLNIDPTAARVHQLSVNKKQAHQKALEKAWQAKENRQIHKDKTKKLSQIKDLRAGKLYKPVLNATQIRAKAENARKNTSSSMKAKMTRLINQTKRNPYLHRLASKWSKPNVLSIVTRQRKINFLHNYLKKNPDLKLSGKNGLAYSPESSGRYFAEDIMNGFKRVANDAKHNPLSNTYAKTQNILDSDFYTSQVKFVNHAKRDFKAHQKNGKYILGVPNPHSVKDVYLAQNKAYGSKYFNVDATPKGWLKLTELNAQAKAHSLLKKPHMGQNRNRGGMKKKFFKPQQTNNIKLDNSRPQYQDKQYRGHGRLLKALRQRRQGHQR